LQQIFSAPTGFDPDVFLTFSPKALELMSSGCSDIAGPAAEGRVQGSVRCASKALSLSAGSIDAAYGRIVAAQWCDVSTTSGMPRTFTQADGLIHMKNGRLLIWIAIILLLAALTFSYW